MKKSTPTSQEIKIKKTEILITVLLGLATILLGLGQYRLSQVESQLKKQDQTIRETLGKQEVEVATLNLVRNYLGVIDHPGQEGQRARQIVEEAASYMSETYGNPLLARLASRMLESLPRPGDNKEQPIEAAVLGITEASEPPKSTKNWFAVLTSYYPTQRKYADAGLKNFSGKLASEKPEGFKKLSIHLYQTKINRNFAITLGGPVDRQTAVQLAAWARDIGWSKTAFAQVDRDWSLIQ
jgi:hypothetical protein